MSKHYNDTMQRFGLTPIVLPDVPSADLTTDELFTSLENRLGIDDSAEEAPDGTE